MMKALLFTLAALCVSAMQAVTTGWTTKQDDVTTTGTFSVALVVNIDTSTITANTSYLTASASSNANLSAQIGVDRDGEMGRIWAGNSVSSTGTIKDGKNVLGIIFQRNHDGKSLTVSYYMDGTIYGYSTLKSYWSTGYATTDIDTFTNNTNGTLYFMNGAATAADFAPLPEPTVFALLALGVAGVALKRKVA